MKKITIILLITFIGACIMKLNAQTQKLVVTIGETRFTATLNDNETVKAFLSLLPLDINMNEMGGYEKYYYLSQSLPGSPSNVGTTEEGDLMIWSGSCLVLFYTTRSTSYSYIRLGRIDNTAGLRQALGSGNVYVKFELEDLPVNIETSHTDVEACKVFKAKDYLEVSGKEIKQLTLYTLNGTIVDSSDNNIIVTSGLTSGLYLLKINIGDTGIVIRKVIIN